MSAVGVVQITCDHCDAITVGDYPEAGPPDWFTVDITGPEGIPWRTRNLCPTCGPDLLAWAELGAG